MADIAFGSEALTHCHCIAATRPARLPLGCFCRTSSTPRGWSDDRTPPAPCTGLMSVMRNRAPREHDVTTDVAWRGVLRRGRVWIALGGTARSGSM